MINVDDEFYDRADEHIHLSNRQINDKTTRGKVSASYLYSAARFNAWLSATGFENSEDMAAAKEETIEYFRAEYEKMLIENLDDYIENFETYMNRDRS